MPEDAENAEDADDAEDDMRGERVIQVRDTISGQLTSQWEPQCQDAASYVYQPLASWNSNNTTYLAHSCWECQAVYVYDISRGKLITQYRQPGVRPAAICQDPGPDTLLVLDGNEERIVQLQWTGDSFKCLRQIQHNHPDDSPNICYSNLNNKIYLAGLRTVCCISLSGDESGQTLWQLGRRGVDVGGRQLDGCDVDVGGQQLDHTLSVCCDPAGRVYISEHNTDRLLVVDGELGELLHVQSGIPG